jgi:hypothetical protein
LFFLLVTPAVPAKSSDRFCFSSTGSLPRIGTLSFAAGVGEFRRRSVATSMFALFGCGGSVQPDKIKHINEVHNINGVFMR